MIRALLALDRALVRDASVSRRHRRYDEDPASSASGHFPVVADVDMVKTVQKKFDDNHIDERSATINARHLRSSITAAGAFKWQFGAGACGYREATFRTI